MKHFTFAKNKATECGLPLTEDLDSTHKDMREVTCQKCKDSPDFLEGLRLWDAGYQSGYAQGFWDRHV